MAASDHQRSLPSAEEKKLTISVAQEESREGVQESEVAATLDSPNLVTRDTDGWEVWIYNEVSTEFADSRSSGDISTLIIGWTSNVVGATPCDSNKSYNKTLESNVSAVSNAAPSNQFLETKH